MRKIKMEKPKASLYPVPTTLVSCSYSNQENIITVSWTGIMSSNPPIIYVSIRPERYSYSLILSSKRICINIPSIYMLNEVDFCGNTTGKAINKEMSCRFNMISLMENYPKAIEQCKHHLLCDVFQVIELGSHTAFLAEVKHEFIDEDCFIGNHQFMYDKIQPIAYCRKDYYCLSKKIGVYGKQKAICKDKNLLK